MRKRTLAVLAAAVVAVGAATAVLADSTADCGKAEGKAYVAVFKALFKESMRACGNGAAMAPRPILHGAAGAAGGAFAAQIGKAVDKFGPSSCAIDIDAVTPEDVLSSMQSFADQACLVP